MILLVDDAHTNIQVLNDALKDDYRVFFATTGKEALKIASESMPDLILLDVIMPDMDGYEVCRSIKSDPILKNIPIIFITAMNQQEDEAIGLELGAVDYICKPFNPGIVRLRVRNQIELKRQRDILAQLSHLDGLTGIPNRRAIEEGLEREWRRGIRAGHPLSLIMVDIDHFKSYNDEKGHLAGDDCLKIVSKALQSATVRAGDMVARYGGEEFLAILPDTDEAGARLVASRMQSAISTLALPHPSSPVESCITISIGMATAVPTMKKDFKWLLETTDNALYKAKSAGRNRLEVSNPSTD